MLSVSESLQPGTKPAAQSWGEVLVSAKTHLYKKIRFYTHENIGWGPISLPEQEMHTTAFWFAQKLDLEPSVPSEVVQNALNGVAHLLLNTAPLELMWSRGIWAWSHRLNRLSPSCLLSTSMRNIQVVSAMPSSCSTFPD